MGLDAMFDQVRRRSAGLHRLQQQLHRGELRPVGSGDVRTEGGCTTWQPWWRAKMGGGRAMEACQGGDVVRRDRVGPRLSSLMYPMLGRNSTVPTRISGGMNRLVHVPAKLGPEPPSACMCVSKPRPRAFESRFANEVK